MTRLGLNASLAYMEGATRHTCSVRANVLTHGMTVIYDESKSRVRRAFYPHRLSSAQFMLGIEVKGRDEFIAFSSWMATYADFILNPDLAPGEYPAMAVSVPSRDFLRKGVPISGYEWGDQVAKMVWAPQIIFETSEEPYDPAKNSIALSRALTSTTSKEAQYFYPTSTQLNGSEAPADGTYTRAMSVSDILGMVPINALTGESNKQNSLERQT